MPDRVTISAGVGHGAPLVDLSVEAWDRVHAVNARGPFLVLRGLARAAIAASVSSSAVVIGSISGTLADQTMGAYCASKAAVEMVVRVAAAEWRTHGIRANAVAPTTP
ncbi:MAG: SDR family oxidoreductase [Acidimicrobiales bacterium]